MLLNNLSDNDIDRFDYKNEKFESFNLYTLSRQYLYFKYSKFRYSYSLICTNNLIFNEKCRIVGRFKDFLISDDYTEFLQCFYNNKESIIRLDSILYYYENYCQIFPNYMILTENKYLYKNIRKKQKLIDAFNEIKREEEENRKQIYLYKNIFNEKIKNSIEKYNQSNNTNILNFSKISKITKNEQESTDKSIVNLSLNTSNKKINNNKENNTNEKSDKSNNNSLCSDNSIFNIIKIFREKNSINKRKINNEHNNNNNNINNNNLSLNKNNINRKEKNNNIKNINNTIIKNKTNNNSNDKNKIVIHKKLIAHKPKRSFPFFSHLINEENYNKTVKIIHNINNIIINDKINNNNKNEMIININSNYYHLKNNTNNANNNNTNKSNEKSIKYLRDKIRKIDLNKKRNTLFKEKRTYTSYNTLSNTINKKRPIFKNILSPKADNKKINSNSKKENYKKKICINDLITSNLFKNDKKLTEYKTLNSISSDKNNNNKNTFYNKIKIAKNKNKNTNYKFSLKPSIETKESKTSVNRKIINHYLTAKKKRVHKRPFSTFDSTFFNTFKNDIINKNNIVSTSNSILDKTKKFTTIKDSNNSKIKKRKIIRIPKTNSIQINNNNSNIFFSSSYLAKEKLIPKLIKDIKKYRNDKYNRTLYYFKTQVNSDTEDKNISKESHNIKPKKKPNNNNIVNNNRIENNKIKKSHNILNENKDSSYVIFNKLKLMKKHRTINSVNWSINNIINNIKKNNIKSPLIKKYIINPDEKIKGIINTFIKSPKTIKQHNFNKKYTTLENVIYKDCKHYKGIKQIKKHK